MTSILTPDYHLWTNTSRFKEFGKTIQPESIALFGCRISKYLIREIYNEDYFKVDYEDRPRLSFSYDSGKIKGHFRTAGCLAIFLAYLMGSTETFIAGLDGYTLKPQEELDSGESSQHLYGDGNTDRNDWKTCLAKDKICYKVLRDMSRTINFTIITPTVFHDFHTPLLKGN